VRRTSRGFTTNDGPFFDRASLAEERPHDHIQVMATRRIGSQLGLTAFVPMRTRGRPFVLRLIAGRE